MIKKGIILAGGTGSRLSPLTKIINKQLLPLYDKPLIFYPLSILMLAGIRDVLIITNPNEDINFKKILKNGSGFGIKIQYLTQQKPNGLPEAFIIGEKFIKKQNVALILGDNFFYGQGFTKRLEKYIKKKIGSTIFTYQVNNPQDYGVVEIKNNKILNIKEKPKKSKSNLAITGLYFFDKNVVNLSKKLKPSKRGELEITDLNKVLLKENKLDVEVFGRGFCWLDAGTPDNLLDASMFIQAIEKRQGFKIACLEEISFRNGFINREQLKKNIFKIQNCEYRTYLEKILNE